MEAIKENSKSRKEVNTAQNINRRSEIYRKALDLFLKKGYDATSMSMIAKVLGMSKANLYYYCPSKENLLYKIHLDDLEKRFVPILDETEKLSNPKERLIFFLRKFTFMCTSSPASRLLVHEIRSLSKSHQNEILSIWRKAYELIRMAIKELQQTGEAQKYRESFLTFIGAGMVLWIVYWWDYSRQTNAEELADTLVQVFLKGILYSGNDQKNNTYQ